jgi:aarF domain-containing kinase
MIALSSIRSAVKKGTALTLGTSCAGLVGATVYANTDSGAGFRREVQFWSKVFPIVADYFGQTSQRSPLVKYHKLTNTGIYDFTKSGNDDEDEKMRKAKRSELLTSLHERHAPEILEVMLDLKGLYVKLGQVLSVTALPVPEAYRELFRTLQSDVPGHAEFESIVKPTLERELGKPIDELFEHIDTIPCGAASIGQAHRAKLKAIDAKGNLIKEEDRDVVVKVQYPDASWQVPADIECVGDFMKMCVYAGVIDKESSQMSFDEFSRQFLSELDYEKEKNNLHAVYESSMDPKAPYLKHNVIIPKVFDELCTGKIITMSFIPGVTMEAEAKRQLELLGIDTSGGIAQIVKNAARDAAEQPNDASSGELTRRVTTRVDQKKRSPLSWKMSASKFVGRFVGVDSILWSIRTGKKLMLWYQATLVATIQRVPKYFVSSSWDEWAELHSTAAAQAARLGEIDGWCRALFDVHGHQILNLGLFNADPHPGNILIGEVNGKSRIGLIDYGQCKKLSEDEQYKVAHLILSVANNEPDEVIAEALRDMEIVTKNDSTEFLAQFGKLMFGRFEPEHLQHEWHMNLHKKDRVLYFPKELSMVYRTSLLLRGLAVSLQLNFSIGEQWKKHASEAVERIKSKRIGGK